MSIEIKMSLLLKIFEDALETNDKDIIYEALQIIENSVSFENRFRYCFKTIQRYIARIERKKISISSIMASCKLVNGTATIQGSRDAKAILRPAISIVRDYAQYKFGNSKKFLKNDRLLLDHLEARIERSDQYYMPLHDLASRGIRDKSEVGRLCLFLAHTLALLKADKKHIASWARTFLKDDVAEKGRIIKYLIK